MKEKILNLKQIAEILNLSVCTVRTYLGNYHFTKFISKQKDGSRTKEVYKFNNSFVNELARFLYIKKKWGSIKLLNNYCDKNFFIKLDSEAGIC